MTHTAMVWTSATMAYTLDYRRRDIGLIPVPMFHVGGMSFVTFFVHMGGPAAGLAAGGYPRADRG